MWMLTAAKIFRLFPLRDVAIDGVVPYLLPAMDDRCAEDGDIDECAVFALSLRVHLHTMPAQGLPDTTMSASLRSSGEATSLFSGLPIAS
jgi:hypothetical protein